MEVEECARDDAQSRDGNTAICIVGVGRAGVNAINRMVDAKLQGVEFISINTDMQDIVRSKADQTIALADEGSRGLGAGADPERGAKAAQEHEGEIEAALQGSDMVFITCGEGGGTGTGASPLVAHVAKELGALTVAVVTRPFSFEGKRRDEVAEKGIEKLKKEVDAIIVISGNRFLESSEEAKSRPLPSEAFRSEEDAVLEAVRGVVQPLQNPYVNVDFDTIKSVMGGAGAVFFGTGTASGKGRGSIAAKKAVSSGFVEEKIGGARKALVSISGSKDLGMSEVNSAMEAIKSAISPEAQIIMGLTLDDALGDDVKVTVYEG